MKTRYSLAILATLALPLAVLAQVTTGWQSPLATGNYTWSDTGNWVDGEINGIFSDGLAGSGKTYPNILFTADATLDDGLVLSYTNAEQNLTFRGDGGDRTLTLGGPVSMNLNKAVRGSVKFGSTTANQGLSLQFTGAPVFDIGYGPWMEIFQPVSGTGGALVTGAKDTAIILALHGDAATFPGAVSATPNKGLYFNSNDKNSQGAVRATDVRLDRADLVVQGNNGAASVDRISGTLTLAEGGMAQFVHYYNSNFKNHTLRVGSLVAEPGAILDIHSPSLVLGATEFESGNNFVVDNDVTTFGSGAAGTVTAPVVPWARASNNNSTGDNLFSYLVSYDAARGFRILDRATEQETYAAGYEGPVTTQGANVYVSLAANELVTFTGNNTVNSLQFSTSGKAGTLRANDGTLTVSSGAIEMTGTDNITLNANLVFGDVPAYITYRGDKTGNLKGTVAGTGGITFQTHVQNGNGNSGVYVEATGTYTNTTYINSRLFMSTPDFLPHGERKGDVVVNGILQSFTGGPITMNGLYGNGALRHAQSYATTFTVGDNNSNGDFNGGIDRANGTISFSKIGAGTQRIAGHCTHNGATTVSGGTLIVDGDFTASSVTVASGAALGGAGAITNNVTVADGGALALGSTNRLGTMTIGGTLAFSGNATMTARVEPNDGGALHAAAITGTGTVAVFLSSESPRSGYERLLVSSDAAIPTTFTTASTGWKLEKRDEGKEIWAIKPDAATVLLFR